MPSIETKPVEDTISKVNDELAVGSDLQFQHKWWRFTHALWIFFGCVIVADLLGCFGRGPLANATAQTNDRTIQVKYERIERYAAPSILRIDFGPTAIHEGKIQFWVGESVIKALGAQRFIPQPEKSVVGQDGISYTFPCPDSPRR
ncbi:MAG: hypothetical protein JO033_14570 [Acidobacteriaceae bacterium]|nr:hypothetical protein [Acidobacteriaceae bacterium]MBV9501331.1 hypothetical protein [Acidobacteriaceae bacterium]